MQQRPKIRVGLLAAEDWHRNPGLLSLACLLSQTRLKPSSRLFPAYRVQLIHSFVVDPSKARGELWRGKRAHAQHHTPQSSD